MNCPESSVPVLQYDSMTYMSYVIRHTYTGHLSPTTHREGWRPPLLDSAPSNTPIRGGLQLVPKIVYGKRLVKNAEKANVLNDQQHGSRPRRMTTDALLLLARLEKDIIRQIKSNSAHMDNNATGCYDRIVVSLGIMACRRAGMPKHATTCQANALRNMRYDIKQLTGISPKSYSGTLDDPLFGTGQESGALGATWLCLAVILINCLDRLSKEDNIPGMFFADPWNEMLAAWRVSSFVDDTNQGVNTF